MSFHADRVDAVIRTAASGHLAQRVVHVHLLVVEGLRAGAVAGDAHPVLEPVDGDHALGAEQYALLIANCPTGPQPQTAIVSPGWMLHMSAAM